MAPRSAEPAAARSRMRRQLRQAALYAALAEREQDPAARERLTQLSSGARGLARHWARQAQLELPEGGRAMGVINGGLVMLARAFGVARIAGILSLREVRAQSAYATLPAARQQMEGLSALSHGEVAVMSAGTNLRAAVLGVNDGLVSNFSIVMGVVGGSMDPAVIVLAGVASLIAGSLSMAAGEYISVKSQREVTEKLIEEERLALQEWPAEQLRALGEIYASKGLSQEEAALVAARIGEQPEKALETKLREQFGVDPNDLGSPVGAAVYSMVAFAAGALVPLIPFLAVRSADLGVVLGSVGASAAALLLVGGGLALTSRVSPLWGAARMLLISIFAAGITFGVGTLLGVAVG